LTDIERALAEAAAQDLLDLLGAYAEELRALAPDLPGVAALREAVGAALAEASCSVSDRDVGRRPPRRMMH